MNNSAAVMAPARTRSLRVTLTIYLIPLMRTLPVLVFMSIAAMGATKVIVHGHRGARAVLPENTLPAFEYAIKAGVDVVELDLAVTRDDVLVVSHDPTINPVICTGVAGKTPIRTLTLEQLRRVDCGSLKNPLYPKQKPAPGAGDSHPGSSSRTRRQRVSSSSISK